MVNVARLPKKANGYLLIRLVFRLLQVIPEIIKEEYFKGIFKRTIMSENLLKNMDGALMLAPLIDALEKKGIKSIEDIMNKIKQFNLNTYQKRRLQKEHVIAFFNNNTAIKDGGLRENGLIVSACGVVTFPALVFAHIAGLDVREAYQLTDPIRTNNARFLRFLNNRSIPTAQNG